MPALLMIFKSKLIEKISCALFDKVPETISHIFFCNCDIVKPIWEPLAHTIKSKHDIDLELSAFDRLLGMPLDKFYTYFSLIMS